MITLVRIKLDIGVSCSTIAPTYSWFGPFGVVYQETAPVRMAAKSTQIVVQPDIAWDPSGKNQINQAYYKSNAVQNDHPHRPNLSSLPNRNKRPGLALMFTWYMERAHIHMNGASHDTHVAPLPKYSWFDEQGRNSLNQWGLDYNIRLNYERKSFSSIKRRITASFFFFLHRDW